MNNSQSVSRKGRLPKSRRVAQKLAPLVVALGMALPVSSVNATGMPVADISHTIQNIFTQLWVEGEEAIKWGKDYAEQVAQTRQLLEEYQAKISGARSEEHTSELQSLMRISYAVFCLKKKNQ